MFPIQDSVPTRNPAFVVWTLIGVNVLVFLHQISLPPHLLEAFLREYALIPARFFGPLAQAAPPQGPADWAPFATNMFLHGGWMHLIANMWTLWLFGPAVEDRLGPGRFLAFYLACGVAASWAHAAMNPTSMLPALGASGAIAGVIGCYVRMFPLARIVIMAPLGFIPIFFEVHAIAFALFWFLSQILPGLMTLGQSADVGGVAWWAHIGGFVAGWVLAPWVRLPASARRPYFADEGRMGFAPDGSRRRVRGPWG
ncbi:rhomboid family intramembrane serine protease [Oceanicella actignis]|uniref:rhomboid family intramembrane serine protease n=1 Tax=Oceanicella actignis TaxID=1189325 RepID=UPI0011E871D3|nr:rhomboid family intramembrane serine protease [Oceanicella actignis]TYO91519.1 membrane associated rhomboid family serine protease [Oceanicella actignis]